MLSRTVETFVLLSFSYTLHPIHWLTMLILPSKCRQNLIRLRTTTSDQATMNSCLDHSENILSDLPASSFVSDSLFIHQLWVNLFFFLKKTSPNTLGQILQWLLIMLRYLLYSISSSHSVFRDLPCATDLILHQCVSFAVLFAWNTLHHTGTG